MRKSALHIGAVLLVSMLFAACGGAPPAAVPTSAPAAQPTSAPAADAPITPATSTDPTSAPAADAGGGVLRIASFEPDSLDPSKGGPGYQEYQNLYEPLVDAYSADGTIKPLAAESFTVSDDGLTYTFVLRPNLKWSDGQPLVAEDFRYAWLRQLDPATASYSPDDFYAIQNAKEYNEGTLTDPNQVGIAAPDERTIVVTLAAPSPPFLRLVGSTTYFPVRKDVIEAHGDNWIEAGTFVGNGPYMLTEWQRDQRLVLERNPNYEGIWKDTRLLDRIEYTVMQDPWSMAVPGYEAGELDAAVVPPSDIDRVRADPTLKDQLVQLPISGAVIMVFDTTNTPTDDVRVRQALSLAIDRETLANAVLKGANAPAASFSPPDLASYNPSSFQSYNAEEAQKLMAEAGYPNGQGFPAFELTHWTAERESLIAQAIAAMWKQTLGIDVTLTALEPQAMRDFRVSRATEPFNAYIALNWSGILDPREFHNNQLDPDQNVRHSRYTDEEYTQLIRSALTERDETRRAELYRNAEALVNRDAPIISLVYEARNWLVRPNVQNFSAVTTSVAEMIRVSAPPGLDVTP